MAHLIMEHSFDEPLTDADLARMMERAAPCLDEYGVRWIRTYVSNTRQRMICAFEAPDAESVRTAYRVSDIPFDCVWPGIELAADQE